MIPSMYVSSSFFSRVFFCSTNSLRRCSFRSSISSMSLSFSFVVMRFFFKAYTSLRCVHHREVCEVIIRLTREDFASEEEFLKWKSWSDGNYHTEDNQDVVEGKHNTSIDDLSEAALSIPAIDVVMERQHEKSERCRMASTMVSQIRDKLTETQFRRLWMYYVGGMTVDEIGRIEGIRHQNISKSIGSAMKKIKKFFP